MKEAVLNTYELATVLMPFCIVLAVQGRRYRQRGQSQPKRRLVLLAIFAVYLFGVYHFTGAGTLYDFLRLGRIIGENQVNLIPFSQKIDVVGYVLNIVLFVPLGMLLPLIWQRRGRFYHAVGYGLGLSLLIEVSQLLNHRSSDVDDLMLNTLGAVIGYGLLRAVIHAADGRHEKTESGGFGPAVYIAALFLGRFLLFHEFRAAAFLYEF